MKKDAAPLNHMQQYCLEQLGFLRAPVASKESHVVQRCNICNGRGHASYQCHRFIQYM